MSEPDVLDAVRNGGRFVVYSYCFSIVVMTFKRSTDVYFIKPGQSRSGRGLGWTAMTLLLGWWGIPWGPIYSIQCIYSNLSGGRDVTDQIIRQPS